jgi:chitodextrinase
MTLAMSTVHRDKKKITHVAVLGTVILLVAGSSVGCAGGGSGNSTNDTTPPTAPAGLTASAASSTQINLSWTASTDNVGVTGYRVERCQGGGCSNFAQIATPTGTTFNDSGLLASTAYSYRVRATDAAGNLSSYSNTASATTQGDTTPPSAPTNLNATATSSTQINLSWTAPTDNVGVTGYKVERCQGNSCSNFTQIAMPTGTTFSDTNLMLSTVYSYRVRATDAAGNLSSYSNTASATTQGDATPPSAPTNLNATVTSSTQINLSWTASTDNVGVTGYRVERCQGSGCSTFAQVGTPTGTTFSDTNLMLSTVYSYRVRATDAAGNLSSYSNTASATTQGDATPPSAPSNLNATATSSTQINLSWTAPTDNVGVTGYKVERCQGNSCSTFAQVGTPTGTTFSDTGLTPSTVYSYRVRATDAAGNLSSYSNTASATTQGDTTPPSAPSNLNATATSSTQINLSWTAPTDNVGVTGYKVERCQGSGCSTFAQVGTPAGTTFSDTGLTPSTAYSYRVRATDAAGNLSSYSNTASATTQGDATPPSTPTNLNATATSSTQINLSWTASTDNVGVTGYRVERCQGSGCSTFAQVGTPTGTTFSDTGLTPSTAYSYRVRATDAAGNLSGYSNTATATTPSSTVTVAISPKRAGVTASQKQQFTATVTDPQNGGVSWSVDATNGGNSTVGTVSTTGLFTPGSQIGAHTVTAISNSNPAVTASASIAVTDLKGVFTYHNDPARTGQNLQEYALTTGTVNSSTFGVLFSCPVDGYVYAQPLYIANFSIGGQTRNVVFVATEHDSVYAFDADASSCVKLWQTGFLSSGVTTVPPADTGETGDLIPEIGITSTPVIDPSTNTIFVVAKTKETVGSGCSSGTPCYVHRLHALDLTTGAEKFGGPVVISATNFVPLFHLQRPALLLNNSTLYIGFGSHGDNNTWQGWLMAYTYSSSTLAQSWVWHSTDPMSGNNEGAIWGSGNGPALDANGNIYVETGNGVFDGTSNFSDSVVKISPAGSMLDFFTPFDQNVMQSNDIDLGSSGPIILPNSVGLAGHPLMIATGKVGVVYLLDQTNMGKFNSTTNMDVGEVTVGFNTTNITGGFFGQPAYWNGNIYTIIVGDSLRQFSVGNGTISTVSSSHSNNTFTFRGATPAVSANGTTNANAIVWVADITAYQSGGALILDAYDATNVSTPLFSSPANGSGAASTAAKFTVPTVANGKVYVGGQLAFTVFGLLPN